MMLPVRRIQFGDVVTVSCRGDRVTGQVMTIERVPDRRPVRPGYEFPLEQHIYEMTILDTESGDTHKTRVAGEIAIEVHKVLVHRTKRIQVTKHIKV